LKSWRNQAEENEKAYQDLVNIWQIRDLATEDAPHAAASFESWKAKNHIDAARVKKLPAKNRLNIWLSRVAAIAFLGFMLWYLYPTAKDDNFWNAEGDNVTVNMIDGSVITLRKNTLMRDIAGDKKDTERRVALSGEAFFKVAPDQSRPFFIEIEDVTVEVVGTEFNVSSLPSESMIEVAVLSGIVKIHVPEGVHTLTDGDRFRWHTGQKSVLKSEEESINAWSWHTGQLQFKSTPLLQVVEALNRHFDTQISLENSTLAHCRFTSNFHSATLEEVIEVLSATFGLNAISNKEGVYHLVGGHCDG
jgi:ferric-dicitrate binding protein FerR (iron transport regulator)